VRDGGKVENLMGERKPGDGTEEAIDIDAEADVMKDGHVVNLV